MLQQLRHIRAFLAVARHLSFTRAAAELFVSQPALTVQIRQLEDSLGLKLFDRDRRQVELTQAGRGLVAPMQRVLAELEAVMHASHDLAGLRSGALRLAVLPSVASSLLPRVLQAFAARHPGITVEVNDLVAENIMTMVKTEAVDMGIGPRVRPDRDVAFADLLTDRMCAFLPETHPLAVRKRLTLGEVVRYPLVLTGRNSSVRKVLERALERQGLTMRLACEANYMSTAAGMVRGGLGISIMPWSAVESASCQGLVVRPIHRPALTRRIGILTRQGRTLSPAASRFADVLREMAREPLPYFQTPQERTGEEKEEEKR